MQITGPHQAPLNQGGGLFWISTFNWGLLAPPSVKPSWSQEDAGLSFTLLTGPGPSSAVAPRPTFGAWHSELEVPVWEEVSLL